MNVYIILRKPLVLSPVAVCFFSLNISSSACRYSSLPAHLKDSGRAMWQKKWDAFISANS